MSKNVAVFVDVANIFYAAKAAGVDIDYVTLLKSATSGRDFVRAYAYTGLDPENENQRQFHSFLSRSGYKVVSKDIRKYGDGRIKANLDIELVVDMMRMAEHIDIAVVVSGDGDFAPAIRAVQQLGVRVEVISFRGNTSSDLIEVADVFTDITHIARVEKGGRSGRRVASEDDLSMTAVPEKETDGGPRRRRGGRRVAERDERGPAAEAAVVTAEAGGMPGNLIVLPGEKLSRVGGDEIEEGLDETLDGEEVTVTGEAQELGGIEGEADTEAGRRRRRRRGGRGRGRGRRADGELVAAGEVAPEGEDEAEDDELLEDEMAPLPQHSTFGSVWDSQLGVPSAPSMSAVGGGAPVDDYDEEDEPEIPEYLLAERRQQGRPRGRGPVRPGQRGRGNSSGYQSAVDRERYGRSGTSAFGGSMTRAPDRGRPPGRPQRPPQQQARPQRPAYSPPREVERPTQAAEPWSEVPQEVQELLRQELARRQGSATTAAPPRQREADAEVFVTDESTSMPVSASAPAAARRPSRRAAHPTETPASSDEGAASMQAVTAESAGTTAKPRAATRKTSTTATRSKATRSKAASVTADKAASGEGVAEPEAAAPPKTRKAPTRRTPVAAAVDVPGGDAAEGAPAAKPRRRTSSTSSVVTRDDAES